MTRPPTAPGTADDGAAERRSQHRLDRRTYVAAVGAAVTGGATARGAAGATETPTGTPASCPEDERTETHERLQQRRAELAAARSEIDDLAAEIRETRRERRARRSRYPESVRATARTTGTALRDRFVTIRDDRRRLLGWPVDDGLVVTHSLQVARADVSPGDEFDLVRPDGTTSTCTFVDQSGIEAPGVALWRTDADVTGLARADTASLDPGDRLVGITNLPDQQRAITLGEFVRRLDDEPAPLVSDVPAYGIFGGVVTTLDGAVVGTIYGAGPERIDDRPPYLDGPVQTEALPWLSEYRHVPIETVVETVEGWR